VKLDDEIGSEWEVFTEEVLLDNREPGSPVIWKERNAPDLENLSLNLKQR
jgi:hypothetical protein